TVQLSVLVNSLKAVTSRRLRNEFLDLRGAYSKPVLWSRSYFADSCGGAPLEVIKQYIQNQRG
ncbi:IS200/IS605-like element ISAs26 family transposase, partial [Aeromonas caviae]|nr:IS200/IS605-like element ISAs26 family transposase [Aeromonas caviae]